MLYGAWYPVAPCVPRGPPFRTSSSLVACVLRTQRPCTVGYCGPLGCGHGPVVCTGSSLGELVSVGGSLLVGVSAPSSRLPCSRGGWHCTRVHSSSSGSGVHSRWASPVDALVGRHVAVRASGGPVLSCRTMVWPRVQLCRVRTRAAAISSWVAGGGASVSWMKVRASCARGDPARFVQAPALDTPPCTTTPSGDCEWVFVCPVAAPGCTLLGLGFLLFPLSVGPFR